MAILTMVKRERTETSGRLENLEKVESYLRCICWSSPSMGLKNILPRSLSPELGNTTCTHHTHTEELESRDQQRKLSIRSLMLIFICMHFHKFHFTTEKVSMSENAYPAPKMPSFAIYTRTCMYLRS